jgi:hypothetical protein
MSTVFDVFPAKDYIPSYRELLGVATAHTNAFLKSYGIHKSITLSAGLRTNDDESRVLPIDLDSPCWWPEIQYAWFHVLGISGGTDAYAHVMNQDDKDDLGESTLTEDITGTMAAEFADSIQQSLHIGRFWCFRRSAGQPAIINIGYGILAASLAELTEGFIFSGDGAWDCRLLPARPRDFLRWYFRPEMTEDEGKREWAQSCIKFLPDELSGLSVD